MPLAWKLPGCQEYAPCLASPPGNQGARTQACGETPALENRRRRRIPTDGITQPGFTRLSSREAGRVRPARRERPACRRASALARSSRLWEAGQSEACPNVHGRRQETCDIAHCPGCVQHRQTGHCGYTSKSNRRFWHVLAGISCCSRCQGSCALARLTTAAMSALKPNCQIPAMRG